MDTKVNWVPAPPRDQTEDQPNKVHLNASLHLCVHFCMCQPSTALSGHACFMCALTDWDHMLDHSPDATSARSPARSTLLSSSATVHPYQCSCRIITLHAAQGTPPVPPCFSHSVIHIHTAYRMNGEGREQGKQLRPAPSAPRALMFGEIPL